MIIIPLDSYINNPTKQSNFRKYSCKSYKFSSICNFLPTIFLFLLLINASQQTDIKEKNNFLTSPDSNVDDFGALICKKCSIPLCTGECSGLLPEIPELDGLEVKDYFDTLRGAASSPEQLANTNLEKKSTDFSEFDFDETLSTDLPEFDFDETLSTDLPEFDFDETLLDGSNAVPSGSKRISPFDKEHDAIPLKIPRISSFNLSENKNQYFKAEDCLKFLESKGIQADDKLRTEISDIYSFVESKVKKLIKVDLFPFIDLRLLYEREIKRLTKMRDKSIKQLKKINDEKEMLEKDFNECKQVEYNGEYAYKKLLDPEISSYVLHSIFYELYYNKDELFEQEATKNEFKTMTKHLLFNLIVFARLNMLWTNSRVNNLIKNNFFKDEFKAQEIFSTALINDYYKKPLKIIDFVQIDRIKMQELFKKKSTEYYNRIRSLKKKIFYLFKESKEKKIYDGSLYYNINNQFESKSITEIGDILISNDFFVLNDVFSHFIEKDIKDFDKITQTLLYINNIVNLLLSKSKNSIHVIEYFFHLAEIKILHYKSETNNEYSLEAVDKLGKALDYFFMTFIIRDILARGKLANNKCVLPKIIKFQKLVLLYTIFAKEIDKRSYHWEKMQIDLESNYKPKKKKINK